MLHVHGPGGIGKTTLLAAFAQLAEECGREVIALDARNFEPTPAAFLRALDAAGISLAHWPQRSVLLIDTYELLGSLDGWLRESFLPQLPAHALVVLAGRNPPAPAWRADLAWGALTRVIALHDLLPDECHAYLSRRGIAASRHPAILRATGGHPLALALAADVVAQRDDDGLDLRSEPNLVQTLLERFLREIPSPLHRQALAVCSIVWTTTEALLARALDLPDAREPFEWLRQLSFIEQGPHGLQPHALAREVLDADWRWRDSDGRQRLRERLHPLLVSRIQTAQGLELQRAWFDYFYLMRESPTIAPYFDWTAIGSAYAEPATPADHAAIVAMVARHQGDQSARIAAHWLARQPQAFLAFRTVAGELFGFLAQLTIHDAAPCDLEADPAVAAALRYAERRAPAKPGEEIVYLRFWMSAEHHQGVSSALNLTAINSSIYWTTHPQLAWNFIAMADPAFLESHLAAMHMHRVPEADFTVGGRTYGVFAHDWREEPIAAWLAVKAEIGAVGQARRPAPEPLDDPPSWPSREAFVADVRQALRDYTRADLLAGSPLMRSRIVRAAAGGPPQPAALQRVLREAAEMLAANPRDARLYRAIHRTYLEPAGTQEQAAELLGLPFNTYRYHLGQGIERIAGWLWQREMDAAPARTSPV